MGRSYSYFPKRDADLLAWASAASGTLSADPGSFGVSVEMAEGFASAVQAFAGALAACAPGVRNAAAVIGKNEQRELLKQNARAWVARVSATATCTPAQRQQLGLTVRRPPSRVADPSAPPCLQVKKVDGRVVTVRLRADTTGMLRGRPIGTGGAVVYSYAGATPPVGTAGWKVARITGKTVVSVAFDNTLPPGATVWLMAAWVGTRLQAGPLCTPVPITFGAAGVRVTG